MAKSFEPHSVSLIHRLIEPGPTVLISTEGGPWPTVMTNGLNMPIRPDGTLAAEVGPERRVGALRIVHRVSPLSSAEDVEHLQGCSMTIVSVPDEPSMIHRWWLQRCAQGIGGRECVRASRRHDGL